ncbi:YcaO-like family protein [Pseudomonas sp.]|uniref:YcaO-like family protein n=1 Tax=Pseudomonas sp. TaxID=306 RepID=UPI0026DD504A|nr:YcaO-like family protein [Pseudomonas sp.]MDO4233583.1 YcaO-like family protein [Pseudomonas sp.]
MHPHNFAVSKDLVDKYPFLSLLAPAGGVVRSVQTHSSQEMHVPRFHSFIAHLGNLNLAFPHVSDYHGNRSGRVEMAGCGADERPELAMVRAVAEAAERYSMSVFNKDDIVTASFAEVGSQGLSYESIACGSAAEYADPLSPLKRIDPHAPVRWVYGYSPLENRRRLVPLIMTHLFIRPWPSEHFWLPISTGVAAHTDFAQAAVAAICEVIERDAIALTWLLRPTLPRIWLDEPAPAEHAEKFYRLRESGLEQLFFDATSELGIPTVYGLQLKEGDPQAAQFINCTTGFNRWDGCAKLIRESAMGRSILALSLPIPDDVRDFVELEHGAIYMGRAEQRPAFDFLTGSNVVMPISRMSQPNVVTPREQLRYLLERLDAAGMEVVLVDLTTDELRDAGLRVIRAVIPALMPMSATYRARYLGHPRILQAQARQAEQSGREVEINPYPQPFA